MPLLSNAQNVVFHNSQLTDISVANSPGPTGIDILFEASVPGAAHDSSARDPPPRCFPGTREQYIEDIANWALPPVGNSPLPLYWMKGPAGVGKSAVAQTCAERLRGHRKLGAAFFFSINRWSHNDNDLINHKKEHYKFFTSIAYQLSTIYPNYRNLLDTKTRNDRSLIDKTIASQFRELIVEPLQELEDKGLGVGERIPVIVDGLDECESREAQREIVEIVAAAARDGAAPLCWAFFSRPEPHIEATFSKSAVSPLCHKAVLPISHNADGDIELYLRAGFEDITHRLNIIMDSPWPSETDMKQIVQAANGLFIYAKTVLRFVDQPDSFNPDALLPVIMAVISNRNRSGIVGESIFAELDACYMLIMQRIPPKMLPIIHRVLAFLCGYPLSSAIMIANFLGLSKVELEVACSQLGAVVEFQRQQEPLELNPSIDTNQSFLQTSSDLAGIYVEILTSLGGSVLFYHKSFKDFLLDPHRSGTYCVKPITRLVVEQWKELGRQRQDFLCWQGLQLVRAPDAPHSTSGLSYPYGNELVNSFVQALIDYLVIGGNISLGADFDFRKQLYIMTTVTQPQIMGQGTGRTILHSCTAFFKCIRGTRLQWIEPDEFPKFDVADFKRCIEGRPQGIINLDFLLSLIKPGGQFESGLRVIGHGPKSIYWYWVIDYDSKTYREFRTIDLAQGENMFREHFGLKFNDRMFGDTLI